MFKKIYFIALCLIFPGVLLAAENEPKVDLTYEEVLQETKAYCDSGDREWSQMNSLVSIPQYPKLDIDAKSINNQITRMQGLETLTPAEKQKLQKELNMTRLGSFDGFKTLEVARLQYRSTMNSLFACTVLQSRLDILDGMRKEIEKALPSKNSEIKKKLDMEQKKLEKYSGELRCNANDKNQGQSLIALKNSATRQYCHYRYYLNYLSDNLEKDKHFMDTLEKSIGSDNTKEYPKTFQEWGQQYNIYASQLDREILRADSTLPRAFMALEDMERNYAAHIILQIIYDDYIRLRNNLSKYMNASTQLYLKAYNAQDANQR